MARATVPWPPTAIKQDTRIRAAARLVRPGQGRCLAGVSTQCAKGRPHIGLRQLPRGVRRAHGVWPLLPVDGEPSVQNHTLTDCTAAEKSTPWWPDCWRETCMTRLFIVCLPAPVTNHAAITFAFTAHTRPRTQNQPRPAPCGAFNTARCRTFTGQPPPGPRAGLAMGGSQMAAPAALRVADGAAAF